MPSLSETRVRQRIGSMGMPKIVWPVYLRHGDNPEITCFYDREKAEAYAAEHPNRLVGSVPLRIIDA